MKKIICEMCESADVVKQDGFYVCQSCGTRYTSEDAKKLMKEVGDVVGGGKTIGEKHLQNARRARGKEDWEEVEKYYNLVEEVDPDNVEAVFYSAYGKAMQSLRVEDLYKRQAVFKTLINSVSIISENCDVNNIASQQELIEQITADVFKLCGSSFVYTETKNGYGNVTGSNKGETYALFCKLKATLDGTLGSIYSKIPHDKKKQAVYILKLRLKLTDEAMSNAWFSANAKDAWASSGDKVVAEIKKFDPSFSGKNYAGIRESQKEADRKNVIKNGIGCLIGAVIGVAVVAVFVWIILAIMN